MSVVGVTYGTVGRLRHFTGSFWKPDEFHLLLSGSMKEEVSKGLSQRPKPSGVILGQGGGLGIISFPFGCLTDPFSLSRTSLASGLWKAEVAERVAWKGGSRQQVEAVARGAGDRGAASGSLGAPPACDAASRGPGAGAGPRGEALALGRAPLTGAPRSLPAGLVPPVLRLRLRDVRLHPGLQGVLHRVGR